MVIDIKIVTPLVAIIAIMIAAFILYKEFRTIQFKQYLPLIFSSVIGVPIGIYYLKETDESLVKIILGIVLVIFAVYKALKPNMLQLKTERTAIVFGLLGGILGGAYNTNGPPIIIYGTLRQWDPKKFRAILQALFLPVNISIVIGHAFSGLWNKEVFVYLLYSFPIVVLAILLGSFLNKKIQAEKFTKIIYLMLIAIGIILIITTLLKN